MARLGLPNINKVLLDAEEYSFEHLNFVVGVMSYMWGLRIYGDIIVRQRLYRYVCIYIYIYIYILWEFVTTCS